MRNPITEDPAEQGVPFITVQMSAGYAVLSLAGEFDSCVCHLFRDELEGVRRSGIDRVVLDLNQVRFINSRALAAIIAGSRAATVRGGRLVVSCPSRFCRNIIRKIGLERLVGVFDTNELAIANLQMRPAGA